MKIYLNNIAKIAKAEVNIEGITVIAGENNTGKSTVGKALFSLINSLSNLTTKYNEEKEKAIINVLTLHSQKFYTPLSKLQINRISRSMTSILRNGSISRSKITEEITQGLTSSKPNSKTVNEYPVFSKDEINQIVEDILLIDQVSSDDLQKTILIRVLTEEFQGQINSIFNQSEGFIELTIRDNKSSFSIQNDTVTQIDCKQELSVEAIYIDDPFILDRINDFDLDANIYSNHSLHLIRKLVQKKSSQSVILGMLDKEKIQKISDLLNSVNPGKIVKSSGFYRYEFTDREKQLELRNLSAGLKTFVLLKTLIENGHLRNNGILILDEPEIHLHPAWQLLFAELIVLLQKEFNLHILLTTHSPYFLRAIEVFSQKYDISHRCRYYLAENHNDLAVISDVSDQTERIYKLLSAPFQSLENERWKDD